MPDHAERKAEHLDLCATDAVAFRETTTLFDEIGLVHDALPELAVSGIDTSTVLVGRSLKAPLVIAAMTGGVQRADSVNRDLAAIAESLGLAFGFGSMRPLLEHGITAGYLVRDVAPTALLLGNLGVVQAGAASIGQLVDLVGRTGVNALCIHLNPAMELIQAGGDDDFRGGLDTLAAVSEALPVPVIVKETGCGISRSVASRIAGIGVRTVDISGAGGTSWVGVETLRARARTRELGERFWDWGIPTAASLCRLSGLPLDVVATGGVRHGLDAAKAIALGATAAGIARPFLQAHTRGGHAEANSLALQIVDEIRTVLLLTGCRNLNALRAAAVHVGPTLQRWVVAGSPLADRLDAFRRGTSG